MHELFYHNLVFYINMDYIHTKIHFFKEMYLSLHEGLFRLKSLEMFSQSILQLLCDFLINILPDFAPYVKYF